MTAPTPTDSGGRYATDLTDTEQLTIWRIIGLWAGHTDLMKKYEASIILDAQINAIIRDRCARLLAIEAAAVALIDGTGGKSTTTEYGECYVPQDGDFERLAGVVGE